MDQSTFWPVEEPESAGAFEQMNGSATMNPITKFRERSLIINAVKEESMSGEEVFFDRKFVQQMSHATVSLISDRLDPASGMILKHNYFNLLNRGGSR